eukprot:TRINITY_DN9545_c0_g1_i12.p1 TRINITY_DN9545_c0_g1~~TRINITY_DN9545_c0_g1_i12.p1  ORF type:complete len:101 (-),score=6.46 TRINITY_DN9545_c0_g1_i12:195-497(-)
MAFSSTSRWCVSKFSFTSDASSRSTFLLKVTVAVFIEPFEDFLNSDMLVHFSGMHKILELHCAVCESRLVNALLQPLDALKCAHLCKQFFPLVRLLLAVA